MKPKLSALAKRWRAAATAATELAATQTGTAATSLLTEAHALRRAARELEALTRRS